MPIIRTARLVGTRVMLNHREYVGGDWENIGKWQMETLQKLPEFQRL